MKRRLILTMAAALLVGGSGCTYIAAPIRRLFEAEARTYTITARTFAAERIIDGDTFEIEYDGEPTSVRIVGIDAPESRDAGGPEARAALAELVGGREVRLEFTEERKRDNFGRLLCQVYLDDLDVGAELVRRGHAEQTAGSD